MNTLGTTAHGKKAGPLAETGWLKNNGLKSGRAEMIASAIGRVCLKIGDG